MKKIIILLALITFCFSCRDKRKIAEGRRLAYVDSLKKDSLKTLKLKQQNDETDKLLFDGRIIYYDELDSIYTGTKKRHLPLPASKN